MNTVIKPKAESTFNNEAIIEIAYKSTSDNIIRLRKIITKQIWIVYVCLVVCGSGGMQAICLQ